MGVGLTRLEALETLKPFGVFDGVFAHRALVSTLVFNGGSVGCDNVSVRAEVSVYYVVLENVQVYLL